MYIGDAFSVLFISIYFDLLQNSAYCILYQIHDNRRMYQSSVGRISLQQNAPRDNEKCPRTP